MSDPVAFKYRAFLSYSHRDSAWGKWLHSALEGYRIDKDLVGRQTPAGPVPKTLRPIFRDREDFSAGHSLTEQTLAALEASRFLIVICSPNAAQSKYVNEEIRLTTRAYNAMLERLVLRHPEQWFWVHRRWKPSRRQRP